MIEVVDVFEMGSESCFHVEHLENVVDVENLVRPLRAESTSGTVSPMQPDCGRGPHSSSDDATRTERGATRVRALFSVLLCCAAVFIVLFTLRRYEAHEVLAGLTMIPRKRILLGLLFSALTYLSLTGYDTLAFFHLKHPLPYRKIAIASFISYAFGNNIGMTMVSGGTIRYRIYSAWGIAPSDIMQVIGFCSFTFIMGFLAIGGLVLTFAPPTLDDTLSITPVVLRIIGIAALSVLLAYFIWGWKKERTFCIRKLPVRIPTTRIGIGQLLASTGEWVGTAAVLYVLLPSGIVSFPEFLGMFLTAHIMGVASSVPGGIGVLEAAMLLFLGSQIPAPQLIGSILVFRILYYLLPLLVAAIFFGAHEFSHRRASIASIISRALPAKK